MVVKIKSRAEEVVIYFLLAFHIPFDTAPFSDALQSAWDGSDFRTVRFLELTARRTFTLTDIATGQLFGGISVVQITYYRGIRAELEPETLGSVNIG